MADVMVVTAEVVATPDDLFQQRRDSTARLVAMGFAENDVKTALAKCGWDERGRCTS